MHICLYFKVVHGSYIYFPKRLHIEEISHQQRAFAQISSDSLYIIFINFFLYTSPIFIQCPCPSLHHKHIEDGIFDLQKKNPHLHLLPLSIW